VRVRATDLEDVATACDGARHASAFLSRDGLASDHVIEVELLAQLPAHEYMAYVAMFGTMRRSIRWSMDSTRCASGPVLAALRPAGRGPMEARTAVAHLSAA